MTGPNKGMIWSLGNILVCLDFAAGGIAGISRNGGPGQRVGVTMRNRVCTLFQRAARVVIIRNIIHPFWPGVDKNSRESVELGRATDGHTGKERGP